ncbi:hypothetical protein VP01_2126g1 [Puccinia sorghi]|uniref:Uncharacterized protein n=1 Tax=Puccinia sorghi TaxID=27349 RepID=A0A0L6V9T7_9BASI|nr:hypothetical protein VP01_2126g1 [Puccinia sorghi]
MSDISPSASGNTPGRSLLCTSDTNYINKHPNQTLSDAEDYPPTYENFAAFPLDHWFWNKRLYYYSKAPWATNPNYKINFNFLRRQAVGWGVAYCNLLADSVAYISNRNSCFIFYFIFFSSFGVFQKLMCPPVCGQVSLVWTRALKSFRTIT